jgi:5-formyltetrahydrofolate cyclo-ligase
MDGSSTKRALRLQARAQRDHLPRAVRQQLASSAAAHALAWCRIHIPVGACSPPPCIALYVARQSELDTHCLRQSLHAAGYRVALPRVVGTAGDRTLLFAQVDATTRLTMSAWGVQEPTPERLVSHPVSVQTCALVVVPCLRVDHAGYRLGYGQGLYDRALSQYAGTVLCLAYGLQRVPHLPAEPHDVPVHHVVTEVGVHPAGAHS